nr:argonaute 2 [Diabrotica virgifera virgifera]
MGPHGDVPQQPKSANGQQRGGPQQQRRPQDRQQTASVKELTSRMSELQAGPLVPMRLRNPEPGKAGRKIPVETNHLSLALGKLNTAYHYDVDLVPDTPKKFLRTVMELFRQQHYPKRYPAFDGRKNLYSTTMLPFGEQKEGEVTIHDSQNREKIYKVKVKFANSVDLSPLKDYDLSRATPTEAIQVVDIVLRCAPSQNLLQVGRSFFHKPVGEIIDLGEGMEMYHGFYQSAIRGWKPLLNVDVAHKPFPKAIPVIEALLEVINADRYNNKLTRNDLSRPLDRRDLEVFGKYMKQLRVVYEIPNLPSSRRSYKVNGINDPPAVKTFKDANNREITIQRYFETEKRCKLRYPQMPTLWVGSSARSDNPILVPIELCTIEDNQTINRKMTEGQTRNMIRYAATSTTVRKNKIMEGITRANFNNHPTVREFGFSVSSAFEKLDARILPPPRLGYAGKEVNVDKGIWRGDKFFQAVTINKWTIVCADRRPPRPDDLRNLASQLLREARGSGMQIGEAEQPFCTIGDRNMDIKKYFTSVKGKYDVIFVVVPNSGPQYSYVKTAAEINVGCLTQCVKVRTVLKMNSQTALNLLLKVNAKLNGTNHFLSTRPPILNRPTMIMGADVTHPSPDSQHIPSVAAVTASYDPKAFKYNICWRLQPPRQEIIEDLENIVVDQLKFFYESNKGQKPQRIIFFRDGVSDGQFEQVTSAEVRAIRAACKRVQREGYEPAITFLVVQKRHHTRLFPLNPRDSHDRNLNVPAGTCVDTHITHPFMQDFYLVSHASIQGVAKPTKYCTLWDDNDMSNDDIEQLTYFLCHMFTRCNRSVSYPAPTYYAHLAAARGKVYIEPENVDLQNLNREYERFKIQDSIQKGLPMFFV